jgi:histidinol-phosphatase (PHP family)
MIDTHIHIERGPYTKEWIMKFINQALTMGIKEIYLLEHSHRFIEFEPMYTSICRYSSYQKEWYMRHKKLSLLQYQKLIEEIRNEDLPIDVKWGLEICYFQENEQLISDVTKNFSFDFVTGSIHWVNGFGFDHKAEFWEGIEVNQLYQEYYKLMLQLVKSNLFTGLAHPDSIKCFYNAPTIDLTDIYVKIAKELVKHNMYAEESGGLSLNYKHIELGMNQTMLNIFLKEGVRICTASDAHKPEDVGANILKLNSILEGYEHN